MKKPFVVEIEERYHRTVVIYAEDSDEAFETAENLCNKDDIEFRVDHFAGRSCEVVGQANEADIRGYENFDESGIIQEAPKNCEEWFLRQAKKAITDFVRDEYDEEADLSNEAAIPVAATDYEDRGLKMQVFVDLPARKIHTYLNGYLVSSRGRNDLRLFASDLRALLDFEDLTLITDEEMRNYEDAIAAGMQPDLK